MIDEYQRMFVAFLFLQAGAFLLMNGVTLWVLFSRRPSRLRAAVLLAAFGALLPTRAYEVLVFFMLHAAMVIAVVVAARFLSLLKAARKHDPESRQALRDRLRFRLADVLWLVLFVAVVAAIVAYVARQDAAFNWTAMTVSVSTTACVTLVNVWMWIRNEITVRRFALFMLLFVPILFGGDYISRWGDWLLVGDYFWPEMTFLYSDTPNGMIGAGYGMSALLLAICLASWRYSPLTTFAQLPQKRMHWSFKTALATARTFVVAAAGVGLFLTGWTYWHLVQPMPEFERPPEPNAYPQLVAIANKLSGIEIPNKAKSSAAELSDFVAKHRAVVDEACDALQLPSQVRRDWWENGNQAFGYYDLGTLSEGFDAVAEVAKDEGRPQDAALYGLSAMRLGHKTAFGGKNEDWIFGAVIEGAGGENLAANRRALSIEQCQDAIAVLEEIERQREPIDAICSRTKDYARIQGGWRTVLLQSLEQLCLIADYRASYDYLQGERDAIVRLLLVDFAIDIYRREQGALPPSLNHLVPKYLHRIPRDPYGGGNLIYQPKGDEFLLYSVGSNEIDDGGEFPDSWAVTVEEVGDLSLENLWKHDPTRFAN